MELGQFIAKWSGATGGAERANYALFLTELCAALKLPHPDPASAITDKNDYVFERSIVRRDGSRGRIDLYKRDCFVLEAKQSRQKEKNDSGEQNDKYVPTAIVELAAPHGRRGKRSATRSWDVLMLNAREQAESYARDLPQDHGWPPFVIVCDVGHSFEIYADFQQMGKYDQFPDRMGFRIYLEDLEDPSVQEKLRAIWTDPRSLDPATRSEKITREVAGELAEVSKALENRGDDPEDVAQFLMRCLFTMFAEDVGLLPKDCFKALLRDCAKEPTAFEPCLQDLWEKMDTGGYAVSIKSAVKRFNGHMFKDAKAFSLDPVQVNRLLTAAKANWQQVEPSIFGTLLVRALSAKERGKLGAHFTPRSYVEKLVTETIISPLREDWRLVVAAAEEREMAGNHKEAAGIVREFHEKLCGTKVLDPACGTGNFLYVALELMKRLEGEVLEALSSLGGQEAITGLKGHTVGPQQFSGIELNPRAAAIAELVLWIGDLQWHFRTRGNAPAEPILQDFDKIEHRDAVLGYDRAEPIKEPDGSFRTRWNGETRKADAISGRMVPDDSARTPILHYVAPYIPTWPDADFIVGNPPFIGTRRLKERQGAEYVDTVRKVHVALPKTVDYVMYWFYLAADRVAKGVTRRSGLITTNSIVQDYSRPVLEHFVAGENPRAKLVYAVTNHPWVDEEDGAAVRVAMTVLANTADPAIPVIGEVKDPGNNETVIEAPISRINTTLRNVPDVLSVEALKSNDAMCAQGVVPANDGFKIYPEQVVQFPKTSATAATLLRPYIIGNDLNDRFEEKFIIDATGLEEDELKAQYPDAYQWLRIHVYPERMQNPRQSYRDKWWLFAEPRPRLRASFEGLRRFIATPYTAQHRTFQFWNTDYVPDAMVYCIPSDDAFHLAILSSSVHATWCRYCSGTLETRPRYNSKRTFFPFPFPKVPDEGRTALRRAAEDLDEFRKARQQQHPNLTLTQMYNVREALSEGRSLTDRERGILTDGCVVILDELHRTIDTLVLASYGWPSGLSDTELLHRLVNLNRERAGEERDGNVAWLRPSFQKTRSAGRQRSNDVEMDFGLAEKPSQKPSLPSAPVERASAIIAALLSSSIALTPRAIAGGFRQSARAEAQISGILNALVRTGVAYTIDGGATFKIRKSL